MEEAVTVTQRHTEEVLTRRHAKEAEDYPRAVTATEAELKNVEAQLKNTEAELKNWEKKLGFEI